jgi:DNA-binding XRE family transcriptional regulator
LQSEEVEIIVPELRRISRVLQLKYPLLARSGLQMTHDPTRRIRARYRNRLRECRLRSLIPTQQELARRAGLSRSVVNALELNRRFLSSPHALLIAEVLDCSLDDLYEPSRPSIKRTGQAGA